MPTEIHGSRIDLRQLVTEHAPAIVEGIATSLPELSPWFPWAQAPPSTEDQIARAARAVSAFSTGTDFEYSLFERGSDELVGGLRVNPIMAPRIAEIGYWVRSDRHRRGFATQAVQVATATALTEIESLTEVEIHMDPANEASRRVAEKAGYRFVCEIERKPVAPAHTGRALVWSIGRTGDPIAGDRRSPRS